MYSTSTRESGLQDVSPDFYAWVFPKCDHVAVGTGTVIDKKGIQRPEICWSSESSESWVEKWSMSLINVIQWFQWHDLCMPCNP